MKKELNLVITLGKDFKLPSVNALYKAGLKYVGGRPIPYIYKDASVKKLEALVDDQLRAIDFSEHIGWIRETKQFSVTNQYILKSGVHRRDVDNMTKAVVDFLTRFIKNELGVSGFDDALFSEMHLYKSIIPKSEHEYLCMRITPSQHNMFFNQIEKPKQILFHFTGDDTGWEDKEFKKTFKELGIKYQLCNTDKKIKEHDTDVLFVNYDLPNFNEAVIEIMEFIYEHKDHGFCFIGVLGDPAKEFIEHLNSLGGSNIRAIGLSKHIDIANLFKLDSVL